MLSSKLPPDTAPAESPERKSGWRTIELYPRELFRQRSSSQKCWMSPSGSQAFRGTGHIWWFPCWKLPLTESFFKKEKLKPKLLKNVLVGVVLFTYDYMAAWELWKALPCSGGKQQLLLWVTRRQSQSALLRGKQPTASFLQKTEVCSSKTSIKSSTR